MRVVDASYNRFPSSFLSFLSFFLRCHYPTKTNKTARGIRLSPLHARLVEERAYFTDISGWEGPAWFAPVRTCPEEAAEELSWGRHEWFPWWKAEHEAVRQRAAESGCCLGKKKERRFTVLVRV